MIWEPVVLDATQEAAVWEPWQPSVGNRVIVRYRPECPWSNVPAADGQHGTVVRINRRPALHGHYYLLRVDGDPLALWCAAIELELIQ